MKWQKQPVVSVAVYPTDVIVFFGMELVVTLKRTLPKASLIYPVRAGKPQTAAPTDGVSSARLIRL